MSITPDNVTELFQQASVELSRKRKREVSRTEILDYLRQKASRPGAKGKRTPRDWSTLECRSHFLDSGSFSLMGEARKYHKLHGGGEWDYYNSEEHFQYIDAYAEFIREHQPAIDLYANVDVIGNPELSWRNQKLLEKAGMKPIPVVHCGTDLKWLRKYVAAGYGYIGLGGLANRTSGEYVRHWIDSAFDVVCDGKGIPQVKFHGFGVATYRTLIRYPWFSVDSTNWIHHSMYGDLLIPACRGGEFCFDDSPMILQMSVDGGKRREAGRHYQTLKKAERDVVARWFERIGVPIGESGPPIIPGVSTCPEARRLANVLFFEELRMSLPPWPWAFNGGRGKGFGLIK